MVEVRVVRLLWAGAEAFKQQLVAVTEPQWGWPTPCEGWTVHDLVKHVVAGNEMAIGLLGGRPARSLAGSSGTDRGLAAAFAETCVGQAEAFTAAAPEVLVAHPAEQITAAEFAIYRCADIVVHAWDLGRAIGADDAIAPELVDQVVAPYVDWVQTLDVAGVFAAAPPGVCGESRQDQLLRQLGRTP